MPEPEPQQPHAPSPTANAGQSPDARPPSETTPPAPEKLPRGRSGLGMMLLMLMGGTVGGLLGWGLIELFGTTFQVSPEAAAAQEAAMTSASPTHDPQYLAEKKVVDFRNTLLRWTLAGAAIAAAVAFTAVCLAPAPERRGPLLMMSPVAGGAFGALGSWTAQQAAHYLAGPASLSAEVASILPHLIAWGLVGAGTGLGVGLVRRRGLRSLSLPLWGAVSGIVAVLAYQFIVMIGFPMENTTPLVPESRWFGVCWGMLGGAAIGLGLGRSLPAGPATKE